MNPAKLKVVELRAELSARGLDTKGNKAALVERLQEALDGENGEAPQNTSVNESKISETGNSSSETSGTEAADTGASETTLDKDNLKKDTSDPKDQDKQDKPVEDKQEKVEDTSSAPQKVSEKEKEQAMETCPEVSDEKEDSGGEPTTEETREVAVQEKVCEPMEVDIKEEPKDKEKKTKQEIKQEPRESEPQIKTEKDAVSKSYEKPKENDTKNIKTESSHQVKLELNSTTSIKKEETNSSDRKRKRSQSPPQRRGWSPAKAMKEDEPDLDDYAVTLSWYDSDLNLNVDKNSFFKATPMSDGGFGYIWAGVRATYGFNNGKVCYQVKLVENCDVSHLEDEPSPNVLRVGWSALGTSLQLGEEPFSYGYGGTGKASVDCKFKNYGRPFCVGDVVTAYLEFTNSEALLSYSLNGEYLDIAYNVPLDTLEGKALAPHILTKNIVFEVNFGQQEPWSPLCEGFSWVKSVPPEKRVAGPKRPKKKSDCEMIMMCGLPGCGKTTWANEYSKDNPDKMYNIIGTNALIDKMKVMGLPRKGNYSGRWDVLIEKCTKCLQRLLDIGCHRRRNFILDQTNVYPAAQRRKMRNFEGFFKKAVVIVPTDEEFKRRVEKRELEEGKDVPDSAVMEMKANFTLPEKGVFDEIVYTELQESESRSLVEKYNKEAIAAGFIRKGPQPGGGISGTGGGHHQQGSSISSVKRFRSNDYQPRQRFDNFRRGPPMQSGGFRRGGGGNGPSSRGGWSQRVPERGGWRESRNHNQGGSMGGGYRQSQSISGDRNINRMGGGGGGGGGSNTGGNTGGGGWRGGNNTGSRGGRSSDYGSDRNRQGMDRNSRGPSSGRGGMNQSSGYDRRDHRDNRQKNTSGNQSHGGNSNLGSSGGSISSSGSGSWNQYPATQGNNNNTPWGGNQQQGNWGQQWNYQQQQWKGYNQQGYNQQGYSQQQGYNQQNYNNWQPYGYPGYSQNWSQ